MFKKMMILMVSTFLTVGIILFALPLQAQPTTFCNSGNSGHIQDESVLVSPITFYGWGMDFTVSDFHSTWVHVSVPLPYTNMQGVKWVRPEVQVIGTAGRVSEVHVYSGGAELQRFNVNWVGPNTNYFIKLFLDDVDRIFGPISLSLKCETGDDSTRFVIKRVCARWVDK